MIRSIIKEIVIILLLLLAVILALGILFYDYIPTNKTVPSVVEYETSATVISEIEEKIADSETVLVTYEITANDLSTYEKKGTYAKGKSNPFSTYQQETSSETSSGSTTNKSNNTSTSSSKTTTNTISVETSTSNTKGSTFYTSTGTK